MTAQEIIAKCDHTLLSQTASWEDIRKLCDEGVQYGAASVCIPPCYVQQAADYLDGRLPVCTVIGFPNGYSTATVKCFEAAEAIAEGADEIDMVANINWIKTGRYKELADEIASVRKICGSHILKVIVETCLLSDEEIIRMCAVTAEGGADYIKTSTGFSTAGATEKDIALMAEHKPAALKIKAAGGINSLESAEELLRLGADRLGSSRIIRLATEQNRGVE